MQVFKLYLKILRSYIGNMLMYIGIFLGVLVGVIIPSQMNNENEGYTKSECDFAVFDYDNSELSSQLISYLETIHNLEVIDADKKEVIQDELYISNIDSVLRINKGFEEAFINGNASKYIEVVAIPDTITSVLFEQNLNSYLSVVNTYMKAGFNIAESAEKAVDAEKASVEVKFADDTNSAKISAQYSFYKFLPWVFIAMCVTGITVVLLSLDKKEIRERIQCSPYKFVRMNMEVVAGVLVTGVAICAICTAISIVLFWKELTPLNTLLYVLNAFCIMANALAITFLVSKVTDNQMVISLMANIISLGMAFICGVFVPIEFLSKTVIKIAHFMPVYWNVKAVEIIDGFHSKDTLTLISYMGIQILFAVAIICIGLIIARKKIVK